MGMLDYNNMAAETDTTGNQSTVEVAKVANFPLQTHATETSTPSFVRGFELSRERFIRGQSELNLTHSATIHILFHIKKR